MTVDLHKQFEMLQLARKELRHQAHIYVGNKNKDKIYRERAGEELDKAAITFAVAAMAWGIHADCARPAGAAGEAWKEKLDPENALKVWQEGLPADAAAREASKIVAKALARSKKT